MLQTAKKQDRRVFLYKLGLHAHTWIHKYQPDLKVELMNQKVVRNKYGRKPNQKQTNKKER